MVNFELSEGKIKKKCFSSCHEHLVDTIHIADPSGMQDACHLNFVIVLTHHGVSVAQW